MLLSFVSKKKTEDPRYGENSSRKKYQRWHSWISQKNERTKNKQNYTSIVWMNQLRKTTTTPTTNIFEQQQQWRLRWWCWQRYATRQHYRMAFVGWLYVYSSATIGNGWAHHGTHGDDTTQDNTTQHTNSTTNDNHWKREAPKQYNAIRDIKKTNSHTRTLIH